MISEKQRNRELKEFAKLLVLSRKSSYSVKNIKSELESFWTDVQLWKLTSNKWVRRNRDAQRSMNLQCFWCWVKGNFLYTLNCPGYNLVRIPDKIYFYQWKRGRLIFGPLVLSWHSEPSVSMYASRKGHSCPKKNIWALYITFIIINLALLLRKGANGSTLWEWNFYFWERWLRKIGSSSKQLLLLCNSSIASLLLDSHNFQTLSLKRRSSSHIHE